MVFSDPTDGQGIVQYVDFIVGTDSNIYPLAQKTANVNHWYDRVVSLILQTDGRWEFDDTNHTDLPIAATNLVANQQDYGLDTSFLEVLRVEAKDEDGNYRELKPIDQADVQDTGLSEFQETAGVPIYYDKYANSLFLYPKPSYASSLGLKVYFKRSVDYFASTDTTKTPGFASIFHKLLAYGAAYDFALAKRLKQANSIRQEIVLQEEALKNFYSERSKDEQVRVTVMRGNFR